jgi:glycosyltransferase involved in cell wall biosynthesis
MKNKRLKILLIPSDYRSGIGAVARHLASSVKDVDFYFFASEDIKKHEEEFLKLVGSVDIVHWLANLSWVKLPPSLELQKFSVPNIAIVHHVDEKITGYGSKEEAEKISAASQCDVIQVASQEWVEFVQARTDTPVFLSHYAINPNQFIPNRHNRKPGERFQIGTLAFAKEMKDRKRIDVLLEALTLLKRQNYAFELVVAGPHWSKLQNAFIDEGIQVKNLGYLPTRKALKSYRYLDLYVCSSDVEGGPLPVLESLASGVPVVSTRVGIATDALSMGGGILVDKGNAKALASAIAKIMDSPALYQQFANEAVEVSKQFSWEKIGREYLTMYEYALGMKNNSQEKNVINRSPKMQRTIQIVKNAYRKSSLVKEIYRIGHKILENFREST